MNVTRNVVNDLLPLYFTGEASEDTRALVEEYFRRDVAFEIEARKSAQALQVLSQIGTVPPDSGIKKNALERAKRLLRLQAILLALASTFSLNAVSLGFSFEIGNGHTRVHWLALPGQSKLVVSVFMIAVVFWIVYFLTRRRVRTQVLG
jgi:hypothetical protein